MQDGGSILLKPGSLAASRDRSASMNGNASGVPLKPASARPTPRGDFTTPDKALKSIPELQQMLKDHNLPHKLEFASSTPKDICGVMNCVAKVLAVLDGQQEVVAAAQSDVKVARLEAQMKDKELEARSGQIAALEQQCGNLQIENAKLTSHLRQDTSAQALRLVEADKKLLDADRRVKQYQHEIRRKEQEYEGLQDRLRRYLAERTRDQNFMNQAHVHVISMLNQPSKAGKLQAADEDMYKAAIKLYVEQQEKLEQEKTDLREALQQLERDHKTTENELLQMRSMYVEDGPLGRHHTMSDDERAMTKADMAVKLRSLQKQCEELQVDAKARLADAARRLEARQQQSELNEARAKLLELRTAIQAIAKDSVLAGDQAHGTDEGQDPFVSRLHAVQKELDSLRAAHAASVEQVRTLRAAALNGWNTRPGSRAAGAHDRAGSAQSGQVDFNATGACCGAERTQAVRQALEQLKGSDWFVGAAAAAELAGTAVADDMQQSNASYLQALVEMQGELDPGATALLREGNPAVVDELLRKMDVVQAVSEDYMALTLTAHAAGAIDPTVLAIQVRELQEGLAAAQDVIKAQRAAILVALVALENGRAQHEMALRALEAKAEVIGGEVQRLGAQNSSLRDEVALLMRSVQEREQELRAATEALQSGHQDAVVSLMADITDLRAKVSKSEAQRLNANDEMLEAQAQLVEVRTAIAALADGKLAAELHAAGDDRNASLNVLQAVQAELDAAQAAYAAAAEQLRKLRSATLAGWNTRWSLTMSAAVDSSTHNNGQTQPSEGVEAVDCALSQLPGSLWFVGAQAAGGMIDKSPIAADVKQANASYIQVLLELQDELDHGALQLLQDGNPSVVTELLRRMGVAQTLREDLVALSADSPQSGGSSDVTTKTRNLQLVEALAAANDVVQAQRVSLLLAVVALENGRAQHEVALRAHEVEAAIGAEHKAEAQRLTDLNKMLTAEVTQLTLMVDTLNAASVEVKAKADQERKGSQELLVGIQARLQIAEAELAAVKGDLSAVDSENAQLRHELEEAVKEIEANELTIARWNDELAKQRLLQGTELIESERQKLTMTAEQRKAALLDAWKDVRVTGAAVIHKEREVRKTHEALITTVQKWAPGFGAGKFLGAHVVKESAALASELIAGENDLSAALPEGQDAARSDADPGLEPPEGGSARSWAPSLPQVKVSELKSQMQKVDETLAVDFSPVKGADIKNHFERAFDDIGRGLTEVETTANEKIGAVQKISQRLKGVLAQSSDRRDRASASRASLGAPSPNSDALPGDQSTRASLGPITEQPDSPSRFWTDPAQLEVTQLGDRSSSPGR